jgi:hypothetical protein
MGTGQTAKVWPVFIFINLPSTFIAWGLLRNVTKHVSLQCFSEYGFD